MHKFYSIEDWKKFAAENPETVKYVAASSGTGDGDWDRLQVLTLDYRKKPFCPLAIELRVSHTILYIRWLLC